MKNPVKYIMSIIRSEQYEIEDPFFERWIFWKVVMLD